MLGERWRLLQCLRETQSVEWWRVADCRQPSARHIAKQCLGQGRRQRAYLERQAIIASAVRNSNLVPLVAADLDGQQPFLVWPWLPAQRLDRWLSEQTTLPPEPVLLWIARQILQGLVGVHAVGYVHANVRPEKILILEDYSVRLIGLGRCELVGESSVMDRQATKYDPPEVSRGVVEFSSARDIYAVAVLMSDLLGDAFRTSKLGRRMLAMSPDARPTAVQLVQELLNLEHCLLSKQRAA